MQNDDKLIQLQTKLSYTKEQLKDKDLTGKDVVTLENRVNGIKLGIKNIVEAKKKMADELKTIRSETRSLKKAYDNVHAKRTWALPLIQNKKEILLKNIGADRGAAHGGDLQGRGCTNLLQNADYFFDDC